MHLEPRLALYLDPSQNILEIVTDVPDQILPINEKIL
jgi:hypothetical protein